MGVLSSVLQKILAELFIIQRHADSKFGKYLHIWIGHIFQAHPVTNFITATQRKWKISADFLVPQQQPSVRDQAWILNLNLHPDQEVPRGKRGHRCSESIRLYLEDFNLFFVEGLCPLQPHHSHGSLIFKHQWTFLRFCSIFQKLST